MTKPVSTILLSLHIILLNFDYFFVDEEPRPTEKELPSSDEYLDQITEQMRAIAMEIENIPG